MAGAMSLSVIVIVVVVACIALESKVAEEIGLGSPVLQGMYQRMGLSAGASLLAHMC